MQSAGEDPFDSSEGRGAPPFREEVMVIFLMSVRREGSIFTDLSINLSPRCLSFEDAAFLGTFDWGSEGSSARCIGILQFKMEGSLGILSCDISLQGVAWCRHY